MAENCGQIDLLPLRTSCPADTEQLLFFNTNGDGTGMCLRSWATIKECLGNIPDPLDFIVDASSTPFIVGQSTLYIPDYIGYNVDFIRGGISQYETDPGDGTTWYSWNKVTGIMTIFTAAQLGEPFRIVPTGGFGSPANNQIPQPVFAVVDVTPGAPTSGTAVWQHDLFANGYVTLFINGRVANPQDAGDGEPFVTKAVNSDTLTVSNYLWGPNDQLLVLITPL